MSNIGKPLKPSAVIHAENGEKHIVGVFALKVMISKDDDHWFAQGLEIDYISQGKDLEDVKKNFENGLMATIHENLKIYGTIEHILKIAPQEEWTKYFINNENYDFSQISMHEIPKNTEENKKIPFDAIAFISPSKTPSHASL